MSFRMKTYREKIMYKALIKRDIRLQMDIVVEDLTTKIEQQNRQLAKYKEIIEEKPLMDIVKLRKKQGDVVPNIECKMALACPTCLENFEENENTRKRQKELANIYKEAEEMGVAKEDLELAKQEDSLKALRVAGATVKKLIRILKQKQPEPPRATTSRVTRSMRRGITRKAGEE